MFPQQVIITAHYGRQVVGNSDSYICLAKLDDRFYPCSSSSHGMHGHPRPHAKWSPLAGVPFDDFKIPLFFFQSFNLKTQCRQQVLLPSPPPPITSVGAISSLIALPVHFTNVCAINLCSLLHPVLEIKAYELQYIPALNRSWVWKASSSGSNSVQC